MGNPRKSFVKISLAILLITVIAILGVSKNIINSDQIQPHPNNPFYWEYKGKPALLRAQSIIKSLSLLRDEFDFVGASPSNRLLSNREENEAYLLAIEGKQYALYFPMDSGDGLVSLDLPGTEDKRELRWSNIAEGKWKEGEEVFPKGNKLQLMRPDKGQWLALILKSNK